MTATMITLIKLFFSFIQIGLFSVGGGYAAIPLIQHQIVDVHQLMSISEFYELITIAEMTPGPISINAATFVGTRLAGLFGAVISTLGCIIPSFIICLTLSYFYYKYKNVDSVKIVISSLRCAVVALISSAAISILTLALYDNTFITSIADTRLVELFIFIGALFVLRKYRPNVVFVILGSGVVGTIIYSILSIWS